MSTPARDGSAVTLAQLIEMAVGARNYSADISTTCAQLIVARELLSNKVNSITSASTSTQYPSAAAVWALFNSITNANEVSY